MAITVRAMTPEDYDAAYAMWLEEPMMFLDPVNDSREGITKYLERNPTTCMVAYDGDLIVGCLIAGHDGRKGIFHQTMVRDGYRGQGIGTELQAEALKALDAIGGLSKVFFTMPPGNDYAENWWQERGFEKRTAEANFVHLLPL